jgi:hypothetical protein
VKCLGYFVTLLGQKLRCTSADSFAEFVALR